MKNLIQQLMICFLLSILCFSTTVLAQPKMYWVNIEDPFINKIQRADLDGANVEDILTNTVGGLNIDNENEKIYWGNFSTGTIMRADVSGNNVEDVLSGISNPSNIDIDVNGGKIYYTSTIVTGSAKIYRANLDGSNVEELVDLGSAFPVDLALDIPGEKIYWKTTQPGNIQRSNLDGSNLETLLQTGNSLGKMDLDLQAGKMYWVVADANDPAVMRANLDGSIEETLVSNNPTPILVNPWGIALDFDNQKIYWTDFTAEKIQRSDFDGSNVEDVITSGLNSPRDIKIYVPVATAVDDDIKTIAANYVLQQNYPNPFNPSTTIKFSLPSESFTTLKIYDILGNEITQLVNEQLPAGNYKFDFLAENLPSGIYFYKITAENFVDTKKMLLLK